MLESAPPNPPIAGNTYPSNEGVGHYTTENPADGQRQILAESNSSHNMLDTDQENSQGYDHIQEDSDSESKVKSRMQYKETMTSRYSRYIIIQDDVGKRAVL